MNILYKNKLAERVLDLKLTEYIKDNNFLGHKPFIYYMLPLYALESQYGKNGHYVLVSNYFIKNEMTQLFKNYPFNNCGDEFIIFLFLNSIKLYDNLLNEILKLYNYMTSSINYDNTLIDKIKLIIDNSIQIKPFSK